VPFTRLLPISLLCLALAYCEPPPGSRKVDLLSSLVEEVQANRVLSVDVIYFPRLATSDRSMTAARLRQEYLYRITIRDIRVTAAGRTLLAALKQTIAVPSSVSSDVRWGLKFTLADGGMREVYLDAFGRDGQVDSQSATFQGSLYRWLRQVTEPLK